MKAQFFFLSLLLTAMPAWAQEDENVNDLVGQMQHELNLSDNQVAKITQVIQRYEMQSEALQQSVEQGTINPSAVDSQRQGLKSQEEQGIAQYLRSDQLTQWRQMESQMSSGSGDEDYNADEYSNLPKNPSSSQ